MLQYLYENNRKFNGTARGFCAALLFVLLTGAVMTAHAQQTAGGLDNSFDGDGKLVTNLGNPDTLASSVVVQQDGKIVVVGLTGAVDLASEAPGASDFLVLRYNADGSPDNSFDGDGRVVTSFGDGEDGAGAVRIQPDGKILVAGAINMKTPQGQVALARYNANGSLDTTFDGDGKLTTDVAELQNVEERAEALILQPDGKILVVVSTLKENFLEDQVFVVRYNADGSRDNSFAGDGITTLPFVIPGGPGGNIAQGLTGNDIALQPDGKVVVAGIVTTEEFGDVFVWRINADGTHDQTFGGRAVTVSFNRSDLAASVFVRPDNKIFVAGSTFDDSSFRNDFTFARFNADGSPDNSFDGDGKKTTPYGGTGITIPLEYKFQADGKIVSAGAFVGGITAPEAAFAVTRFDANGNLDATFGDGGKAVTEFGDGLDSAQALVIQTDGRVVAAGVNETEPLSDNYNLAVARYLGGAAVAPGEAPFDFDGDGKSDISSFRPADGTWYIQPSGANDANALYGKQWGLSTDKLAPADYDGDGKTDIAVWRESEGDFYILNSSNDSVRVENFGLAGDELTVGDWDGDGRADLAVYRDGAQQSFFYYRGSLNNPAGDITYLPWGLAGDKPLSGDYDGDGKLDAVVFRASNATWYIRRSSDNQTRYENWGLPADKFVPADYDGDGKADLAVFRDGTWYIRQSSNNAPRYIYWGLNSDRLVPADYDGDGKTDAAVFRAGVWYLMESSSGSARVRYFGLPDDLPVANAFVR